MQAKQKNKKAEAIMVAAHVVFLEQGFSGASMDAIAAEAQVSKATVYAHYKSKDGLFARMVDEYVQAQNAEIERIGVSNLEVREALYRVTRGLLKAWSVPNTLQFGRMMIGEGSRFPELGRMFVQTGVLKVQEQVAQFLRSLVERGLLSIADPAVAAEFLIALTRGPVQIRSLAALGKPPGPAEIDTLAEDITSLFLAAYGAVR